MLVLVLPRIEPVRRAGGGAGDASRDPAQRYRRASSGRAEDASTDPELDGLRPYRQGSPASRIYWPALARGDELLERRLEPAGGSGPLVVLDASGDPEAEEQLDRAVRATASICRRLAELGGCELLLAAGRTAPGNRCAARDHGMRRTLHSPSSTTHGAPSVGELAPGSSVIWVCGARSRPAPAGERLRTSLPAALPLQPSRVRGGGMLAATRSVEPGGSRHGVAA